MNVTQRYGQYKKSQRKKAKRKQDTKDPVQDHIDNMAKIIKGAGMGVLSALDTYIITMIETEDRRRALIDIDSISEVEKAIEKDISAKITKGIMDITKGININIS